MQIEPGIAGWLETAGAAALFLGGYVNIYFKRQGARVVKGVKDFCTLGSRFSIGARMQQRCI